MQNECMPPRTREGEEAEPLELAGQAEWKRWLQENHERSPGIWLKIAKKQSPRPTVTYDEALDAALCWGWIDGQKRPLDEHFWLQRFTRRGARSQWSKRNREKAEQLIADKRMRPPGQAQVDAARADGRWEAAYPSQSSRDVPEDFQRALEENPAARELFASLNSANRYSFIYRIHMAKRPETRARRIEQLIEMLAEQRTFH